MKEFVQKFKRAVRESKYERRLLIEEFKREIIRVIRKKLIKAECTSRSIKQWYQRMINLDKHRKKKKKLRER